MSWNHRVIKTRFGTIVLYAIHEVHYEENSELPHSWTENAIEVAGSSKDDLTWTLAMMLNCINKPPLEIVDNKLQETDWE